VFDDAQRLQPDRTQSSATAGVAARHLRAREPRPPRGRQSGGRLLASEARELEARVLAGVVADLHDPRARAPSDGATIAVLFRTLNQVKAYEYALPPTQHPLLRREGAGGFFQCQEIRDVMSLLAAVADPDDALALAAVLRSAVLRARRRAAVGGLAWPEETGAAPRLRPAASGRADDFADCGERAGESSSAFAISSPGCDGLRSRRDHPPKLLEEALGRDRLRGRLA